MLGWNDAGDSAEPVLLYQPDIVATGGKVSA